MSIDIDKVNEELRGKDPLDIVRWAVEHSDEIICSTNFRPHEAVILHMATQIKPDMPILWADGGYALKETYVFAQKVIDQLNLNMKVYNPLMTTARREAVKGTVPSIDDKEAHDDFTWDTKIEPFRRGLDELKPKVWLTAIRKEQTETRASLDHVSMGPDGVIKVSPVFYFTDEDMEAYLAEHDLPDEKTYFDPTKVLAKRECGLHVVDGKLQRANQ